MSLKYQSLSRRLQEPSCIAEAQSGLPEGQRAGFASLTTLTHTCVGSAMGGEWAHALPLASIARFASATSFCPAPSATHTCLARLANIHIGKMANADAAQATQHATRMRSATSCNCLRIQNGNTSDIQQRYSCGATECTCVSIISALAQ